MKSLQRKVLEQLISGSAEPVMVAQISRPDWPVVLTNPAFDGIAGEGNGQRKPFADVVEQLVGRDLALEISETVRAGHESSIPVELNGREYLLVLKPLTHAGNGSVKYYGAYWRGAAGVAPGGDGDVQQALIKAKRRIHDLAREDPVTGLLNSEAFCEVLEHDWAVARREKTSLALVALQFDDFDRYVDVFGRHAADSCQRRVAQAVRRCLRRASDVAARVEGDAGERLVVLSHSSDADAVKEFAARIAAAVRELGLHHPRSRASRFVTVSYQVAVRQPDGDSPVASDFLKSILN